MSRFWDVQAFIREANRVTTFPELSTLMEGMSEALGFDYFALAHHVAYAGDEIIELLNYPSLWYELIKERKYVADDPMIVACQNTGVGFRWADVPRMITLTERQHEILRGAREAGIGGGFTVPVHIPGEYAGSCSFGVRLGRDFSDDTLPAAQYIGCFAFEAARRVVQLRAPQRRKDHSGPPRLTPRQLDCVMLAAKGNSDWHAAQRLGISDQTVHQHIEDAKRRYGVTTRLQLIVRALFDGHITFRDVMH